MVFCPKKFRTCHQLNVKYILDSQGAFLKMLPELLLKTNTVIVKLRPTKLRIFWRKWCAYSFSKLSIGKAEKRVFWRR